MANRPIGAVTARKVLEIDRVYAAVLARGFATEDFDGQPEPETLQCRNEHDRTNWLVLMGLCEEAIAGGLGDQLIPVPIRCTSNRMYVVSFDDCLARLRVLRTQAAVAQANWWRLKDAARAVHDWRALEDLDLTEGWP